MPTMTRNPSILLAVLAVLAVAKLSRAASLDEAPLPPGCEPARLDATSAIAEASADAAFPPLQLEVEVPVPPMAFPAAGRTFLVYELYLRNFLPVALDLESLAVVEPVNADSRVLATMDDAALESRLLPIGRMRSEARAPTQIAGGGTTVVFVCMAFEDVEQVPVRVRHRVTTAQGVLLGSDVMVDLKEPARLGPPLRDGTWLAASGPGNESYHRRGIVLFDGRSTLSRRFAIDWVRYRDGASFSGDESDVREHFSYGAEVLAVADGTVLDALDGIPDNPPRTAAGFRPAVAMTAETIPGNSITLDRGNGHFAHYMHLRPGSLQVQPGDRVQRGQRIATVGNSGDSRSPHLHFDVSTSREMLSGEGVPYVIDQFSVRLPDESWERRLNELPLSDYLVEFTR